MSHLKINYSLIFLLTLMFVATITLARPVKSVEPAYWEEEGVIDKQSVNLAADSGEPPYMYMVHLAGDYTSHYRFRLTPGGWWEWRWIDFDGDMACGISGTVTIEFPSDVKISVVNIALTWGLGSYTIMAGGQGYNYIVITMLGIASWHLYLRTATVPQHYWGSTVPIDTIVNVPEKTNSAHIDLGI